MCTIRKREHVAGEGRELGDYDEMLCIPQGAGHHHPRTQMQSLFDLRCGYSQQPNCCNAQGTEQHQHDHCVLVCFRTIALHDRIARCVYGYCHWLRRLARPMHERDQIALLLAHLDDALKNAKKHSNAFILCCIFTFWLFYQMIFLKIYKTRRLPSSWQLAKLMLCTFRCFLCQNC